MHGFGNDFETEALPGALPQGMNSPQKCNYGLCGKQLSGTAFTAPSHQNERTWCYRIRPSVKHTHRLEKIDLLLWKSAPNVDPDVISLGQYRWDALPHSTDALTFVTGMRTISVPRADEFGSLMELSRGGRAPFTLSSGERRSFVEDGDTITLCGHAQGDGYRIGFGNCTGTILPAIERPNWPRDAPESLTAPKRPTLREPRTVEAVLGRGVGGREFVTAARHEKSNNLPTLTAT